MSSNEIRFLRVFAVATVLAMSVVSSVDAGENGGSAQDDQRAVRSAADILRDITAIEFPTFDLSRRDDAEYVKEYDAASRGPSLQQCALIEELCRDHPEHELAKIYFAHRLQVMLLDDELRERAKEEIQDALVQGKESLFAEPASFALAKYELLQTNKMTGQAKITALETIYQRYVDAGFTDENNAGFLLGSIAMNYENQPEKRVEVIERMRAECPNSIYARRIDGQIHLARKHGQEFPLTFEDAITGKPVDVKDYRGKVVVIECWATWCGPCIRQFPKLRELEEKYSDDLVIIGVSFDLPEDQGGLQLLRDFVKENKIHWPQYYSRVGEESPFGEQWGINSLPTCLVLDREGKLVTDLAAGQTEKYVAPLFDD